MNNIPLLLCLASTLYMTGLIWFVQVVHYPLFSRVGASEFDAYHDAHSRRTVLVVLAPMAVELVSSLILVIQRPPGLDRWMVWAGFAAASLTWLTTALVQVPIHTRLARGFDPAEHKRLVRTNTIRLIAWNVHAILILWMVASVRNGT